MEIKYRQRINKCGRLIDYAEFNGIEFIKNDKNYYRNIKYGRLHRYIYEFYNNCKIPEGYDVHHKDHNKLNNNISNLILLTHSKHAKEHKGENHPMYIPRTSEMYEDIKNGISYKDFCSKYNVSVNIYYSIKNELKQIKAD